MAILPWRGIAREKKLYPTSHIGQYIKEFSQLRNCEKYKSNGRVPQYCGTQKAIPEKCVPLLVLLENKAEQSEFSFSWISNVLKYCLQTYTQINYRLRMNKNIVQRTTCGLKKKQWENGRNYVRRVVKSTEIRQGSPCASAGTRMMMGRR